MLPDITSNHTPEISKTLQWVGMENIAAPLLVDVDNVKHQVSANTALYVSLDNTSAKGIHMSRLHLALNQILAGQVLSSVALNDLLVRMVESQQTISNSARVVIEFDLTLKKYSLSGKEFGYQSYPIKVDAQLISGELNVELSLTIPYSSTCPCSASLSRQLYSEAVDKAFKSDSIDKNQLLNWIQSEAGSVATPHSQRSYAYIKLALKKDQWLDLSELVFNFEKLIGTPVQTVVKREDEQEFARLNAENLLFCEDAARRLKDGLENMDAVADYWFKVEHQESLHAHNAVVIDQKLA